MTPAELGGPVPDELGGPVPDDLEDRRSAIARTGPHARAGGIAPTPAPAVSAARTAPAPRLGVTDLAVPGWPAGERAL